MISVSNSGSSIVAEYEEVSGQFTLTDDLAGTISSENLAYPELSTYFENPKIVKVTSSYNDAIPGVVFECDGTNVVKYSGAYGDVFERSWKYVMPDMSVGAVKQASQIPQEMTALYAFIPPKQNSKIITLTFWAWTHNDGVIEHTPDAFSGKSLFTNLPQDLSTIQTHQITAIATTTITVQYDWRKEVDVFNVVSRSGKFYKDAVAKGLLM